MKEYKERNRNRTLFFVGGFIIVAVAAGIFLQQRFFHTAADINGVVYPAKLSVGDTLYYRDFTQFSTLKRWNFGNGDISVSDSGFYIYRNAGYYQVSLTIDNRYSKTFPIQVLGKPEVQPISDSVTTIEAPDQAMQFENVIFRADSKNARFFSWKFGETGTIDSKEQMAIYAYQTPGTYVVTLFTDETKYPITHKIIILPSYKEINDSVSVDDMYKKIDDDFKVHLQRIANGDNFNTNYNYLLNKYLCNQANVAVKVNNSKINSFYYYCAGLVFDKNVTVQAVKTGFDESLNCVTKIEIIQSN